MEIKTKVLLEHCQTNSITVYKRGILLLHRNTYHYLDGVLVHSLKKWNINWYYKQTYYWSTVKKQYYGIKKRYIIVIETHTIILAASMFNHWNEILTGLVGITNKSTIGALLKYSITVYKRGILLSSKSLPSFRRCPCSFTEKMKY